MISIFFEDVPDGVDSCMNLEEKSTYLTRMTGSP